MVTLPVSASLEAILDKEVHRIAESVNMYDTAQQIKLVHDYLVDTVTYDHTYSKNSGFAHGALLEGKATCQGYSFAFYEIMQHLFIPCNIWIGLGGGVLHAWNFVELNDYWYDLDVTWDDKDDGNIYYDWFMLTQFRDHYVWFLLYDDPFICWR